MQRKFSLRTLIALLSLLLVAAIAFTGTIAYLTQQTNQKINNFSFPKGEQGLSAILLEPDWDGIIAYESVTDEYGSVSMKPVYGYDNTNTPIFDKPSTNLNHSEQNLNGEYGEALAQNMIPGAVAYKNPFVKNTGSITDEWVALKVTYVYSNDYTYTDGLGNTKEYKKGTPLSDEDMSLLFARNQIIRIDFNNTDWEKASPKNADGTISSELQFAEYYCKSCLKIGESTKPLFTSVSVPSDIGDFSWLGHLVNTGFTIYIEGFAAQSDVAKDYEEFKTWGAGNVQFTHTPTKDSPADMTA